MQKPQVDHLRCFSITTGFHGCWCQKIPDANNLHFLIRLLSSTLHLPVSFVHTSSPFPCHALCWALPYNWTHCAEALTFNLPACGHMCICAGTTLPANISTARTSKAGTTWARRLPCTAVSHDPRPNRILASQVVELHPGNDDSAKSKKQQFVHVFNRYIIYIIKLGFCRVNSTFVALDMTNARNACKCY